MNRKGNNGTGKPVAPAQAGASIHRALRIIDRGPGLRRHDLTGDN